MTKYWGPLGWITLHSVAALYPDYPSQTEIQLVTSWISLFAECITCATCAGHFRTLLSEYSAKNPDLFSSRAKFMTFILRAHNTVNVRIQKRVYSKDDSQLTWSVITPAAARSKRIEYLKYLQKDWGHQTNLQGISTLMKVRQLGLIEEQYWSTRSLDWTAAFANVTDVSGTVTAPPSQQLAASPTYRFKIGRFGGQSLARR